MGVSTQSTWGVTLESSQSKVPQLFRTRHKENTKMKHLALLSMVTLASCAPQSLVVTSTSPQCNSDEEGCLEVKTNPSSSTVSTTSTATIPTTTTTTTSTTTTTLSTTTEKQVATEPLETTKFHIKSEVQFRYARTVVESTVSNPDVAISALVEGSCCWQLFGEVNFAGPTAWLRPGGIYKGTDSFGRELFQEVSSLRRVEC